MKIIFIVVSMLGFLTNLSIAQEAESPSWNYVEVGYGFSNVDDTDFSLRGFGGRAYAEVHDYVFLSGSVISVTDNMDLDLRETAFTIGGGLKFPVSNVLDLYSEISYVSSTLSVNSLSETINGYSFGGGLRALIAPKLEVDVNISYVKYNDFEGFSIDGITAFSGGLTYMFTENVGAGFEVGRTDEATSFVSKIRFAF